MQGTENKTKGKHINLTESIMQICLNGLSEFV